jgi:hypothetical protein
MPATLPTFLTTNTGVELVTDGGVNIVVAEGLTLDALSPVSVQAEIAYFAQPAFTVIDTGTNTELVATATPGGDRIVRCLNCTVSFSAAPALGTEVWIEDGDNIIWRTQISVTGRFVVTYNFSRRPLRSSRGAALSVVVDAAGADVVQTVVFSGDYVRAP